VAPRPIEGVPTSTAPFAGVYLVDASAAAESIDAMASKCAPRIRRETLVELARLADLSPDWTDRNDGDPGVTLVQLLAWLAEMQLYRGLPQSRDALPAAKRLALAALALVAGERGEGGKASCAVALLSSRPLDEARWSAARECIDRHVASGAALGGGIVEGLAVAAGDGGQLAVAPGSSVDPQGGDVDADDDDRSSRRAVKRRKDP
jgi:hypothetical protein